jgi:hypothetical protein
MHRVWTEASRALTDQLHGSSENLGDRVLASTTQKALTDARRVTGRLRIRPHGLRCRHIRDGRSLSGRAALFLLPPSRPSGYRFAL